MADVMSAADLLSINDEDLLRRMWSETEDFGRKKQIRARMYKIREQRLKDFYTTGDVVTEVIPGKKHTPHITHADSIGDQGFMSMKTKEIRDSESPTMDMMSGGHQYWTSMQENRYSAGVRDDGAQVATRVAKTEGHGVSNEGNTETHTALAGQNLHEVAAKEDESGKYKSEAVEKSSAVMTSSKTVGDSGQIMSSSAQEESKSSKREEQMSSSTGHTTTSKWSSSSSTSSTRKVVSSSSYQTVTGGEQIQICSPTEEVKAIETSNVQDSNLSKIEKSGTQYSSTSSLSSQKQISSSTSQRRAETQEFVQRESEEVKRQSQNFESKSHTEESSRQVSQSQSQRVSSQFENDVSTAITDQKILNEIQKLDSFLSTQPTPGTMTPVSPAPSMTDGAQWTVVSNTGGEFVYKDEKSEQNVHSHQVSSRKETRDEVSEFSNIKAENQHLLRDFKHVSNVECNIATSREVSEVDNRRSSAVDVQVKQVEDFSNLKLDSVVDSNQTVQTTKSELRKENKVVQKEVTDKKESSEAPKPIEKVSPVAPPKDEWQPNEGGDYRPRTPQEPLAPGERSTPIKHPTNLELPKDATEGQYVTTYADSYNRISNDTHSPSHEFFLSTLRGSPTARPNTPKTPTSERCSPERKSRKTPERKMSNESYVIERHSDNKRKPSANQLSPTRRSPTKERKMSSESYVIERHNDSNKDTRTSTTTTTTTNKDKSKRKFSSTQAKQANKARVATPGASPDTSPSREAKPRKASVTDSDTDDVSTTTTQKFISSEVTNNQQTLLEEDVQITQGRSSPARQRGKSPTDYSSEGSVGRELKVQAVKTFDSIPERSAFAPIKTYPPSVDQTVTMITEERRHTEKTTRGTRTSPVKETRSSSVTPCSSPERSKKSSRMTPESSPERSPIRKEYDSTRAHYMTHTESSRRSSKDRQAESPERPKKAASPERAPKKAPYQPGRPAAGKPSIVTKTPAQPRKSSIPRAEVKIASKPKPETKTPVKAAQPARKPVQSSPQVKPSTTVTRVVTKTVQRTTSSQSPVRKPAVPTQSPARRPQAPAQSPARKPTPATQSPVRRPVPSTTQPRHSSPAQRAPCCHHEDKAQPKKPRIPDTPTKASTVRTHTVQEKTTTRTTKPTTVTSKPRPKTETLTPTKGRKVLKSIDTVDSRTTKTTTTKNVDTKQVSNGLDLDDENPPDEFYADLDDEDQTVLQSETRVFTSEDCQTVHTTRSSSPKKPVTHPKTPKKKTGKKNKIPKDEGFSTSSSSSSEDENDNIPEIRTNDVSEAYDMTTEETQQNYRTNVGASTDELLTVIVQEPKSSRDSSPGKSGRSMPRSIYTTSDEGETDTILPSIISMPEDVEVFDSSNLGPARPIQSKESRTLTKIMDMEEEEEEDENVTKVSVADRVSKYMETTKTLNEKNLSQTVTLDSSTEVSKAKQMFETIAKQQAEPSAPSDKKIELYETNVEESTVKRSVEKAPVRTKSPVKITPRTPSPVKEAPRTPSPVKHTPKSSSPTRHKSPTKESPKTKSPTRQTKQRSPVRDTPRDKSLSPQRRPKPDDAKRPFERKSSGPAPGDVSSKKAFFERKVVESVPKPKSPESQVPGYMRETASTTTRKEETQKEFSTVLEKRNSLGEVVFEEEPQPQAPAHEGPFVPSYMRDTTSTSVRKETIQQEFKSVTDRRDSVEFESFKHRRSDSTDSGHRDESPTRKSKTPTKRSPGASPERSPKKSLSPERARVPLKNKDTNIITSSRREKSPDTVGGKFGVTLRQTTTTTTTSTHTSSSPSKTVTSQDLDIESIFDLDLLEELLVKAVAYDERRRIRAQIRIVKKQIEEELSRGKPSVRSTVKSETTYSTSYRPTASSLGKTVERKEQRSASPEKRKSPERKFTQETRVTTESIRRQSPERRAPKQPSPDRRDSRGIYSTQITETKTTSHSSPERTPFGTRSSFTTTTTTTTETKSSRRSSRGSSPEKSPDRKYSSGFNSRRESSEYSSRRESTELTNRRSSRDSPDKSTPLTNGYHRPTIASRGSKTDMYEVRTHTSKQVEVKGGTGTESITSSYGVGPTDENGLPLFGLKALRRTNTNKTIDSEDFGVEDRLCDVDDSLDSREVLDVNGRPLFGLRALKASNPDDMPSNQLKQLVERHQQFVRESTVSADSQPRQKPKAKLRDSFILNQDEDLNALATVQPVGIDTVDTKSSNVRSHMESKSVVVSSRSTVSSDGKVSLTRDVIKGELSAKNGETPSGRVTRTQYSFQTQDKYATPNISTTTTTALIGGRNGSGPLIETQTITEATDAEAARIESSSARRGSTHEVIVEEASDRRDSTKYIPRTHSPRITEISDDSPFSSSRRRSSGADRVVSTTSSARNSFIESESRKSSLIDDSDVNVKSRKPVVRGDSVKALQHKFQQATEAANNPQTSKVAYPKAGLILRTNSLNQADDHDSSVSSSMKNKTQSVERSDSRSKFEESSNRSTYETKTVSSTQKSSSTSSPGGVTSTQVSTRSDSRTVKASGLSDGGTQSSSTSMITKSSVQTSSGGYSTHETKVQDLLQRLKSGEPGGDCDTIEDEETRALVSKILTSSTNIEQGLRNSSSNPTSPSSAALVSQAEKQRVLASRKHEDLDDITDEKQLRILLEASSDLDQRSKIRSRLRAVMAECKGVGELEGGMATGEQGECLGLPWKASMVEDSGTESGEDPRIISPQLLEEVQGALSRLEGAIPALDPSRRGALTQLMTRIQSCLKLPPSSQPQPTPITVPESPQAPAPVPPPRRFGNKRALRNRHTVGVTREELADARRWLSDSQSGPMSRQTSSGSLVPSEPDPEADLSCEPREEAPETLVSKVFRPVRFSPPVTVDSHPVLVRLPLVRMVFPPPLLHRAGYFMEPAPQIPLVSYVDPPQQPPEPPQPKLERSSSLLDYDPSINLFTPEQSVQIAVHKAAIAKQISQEEQNRQNRNEQKRRESSEDGDVSSTEEDALHMVSSAQRLLQLATENIRKNPTPLRYQSKGSKKLKMKRSNTIDIPKPATYFESSGDECGASADEVGRDFGRRILQPPPPNFEPKTENDLKFLAFLKQAEENSKSKIQTYNPSARGGKHWSNRFSSIKTAFEDTERRTPNPVTPTAPPKPVWAPKESKEAAKKLPWSVKAEEEGVVVGSLTVAKPSPINQFNHAPRSAFRPVEKKTTGQSAFGGTVKQLAIQKFSVPPPEPERHAVVSRPAKPSHPSPVYANSSVSKTPTTPVSKPTQKHYAVPPVSTVTQPLQEHGRDLNKYTNHQHFNSLQQRFLELEREMQTPTPKAEVHHATSYVHYPHLMKKETGSPLTVQAGLARVVSQNNPIYQPPGFKVDTSQAVAKDYRDTNGNSNHYPNYNEYNGRQDRVSTNPAPPPRNLVNHSSQQVVPTTYQAQPVNGFHSQNGAFKSVQPYQPYQPVQPLPLNSLYNSQREPEKPVNHVFQPNRNSAFASVPKSMPQYQLAPEIPKVTHHNQSYTPQQTLRSNVVNGNQMREDSVRDNQIYMDYKVSQMLPQVQNGSTSVPQCKDPERRLSQTIQTQSKPEQPIPAAVTINFTPDVQGASNGVTCYAYIGEPLEPTDMARRGSQLTPGQISGSSSHTPLFFDGPHLLNPASQVTGALSPQSNGKLSPSTYSTPLGTTPAPHPTSPSQYLSHERTSPYAVYNNTEGRPPKSPSHLDHVISPASKDSRSPTEQDSLGSSPVLEVTEERAVSKVMGQAQCQTAVTVNNRTRHRFDAARKALDSELRQLIPQSIRQKALSPSLPNALQKSESWHQMVKEQMQQAKQAPPLPKVLKAKSSHSLAFPKPFEASLRTDQAIVSKQTTVSAYLSKHRSTSKAHRSEPSHLDQEDDLENVDEVFESIFQESTKKRNSK